MVALSSYLVSLTIPSSAALWISETTAGQKKIFDLGKSFEIRSGLRTFRSVERMSVSTTTSNHLILLASSSALLASCLVMVSTLLWPWLARASLNSTSGISAISAAFPRLTCSLP